MYIKRDSKGYVSNIQNLSLHDGPGIRTTIFLAGCPLSCQWCANPETWYKHDVDELKPKELSVAEVVEQVLKQAYFHKATGGGITFSGGEATLQREFLEGLVTEFFDLGLHMALETCGLFDMDQVGTTLRKMDLIYYDLKLMDDPMHIKNCGHSNERIKENLIALNKLGPEVVLRLIVIEDFHGDDHFMAVANFLKENQMGLKIELMPYHQFGDGKYDALKIQRPSRKFLPPSKERLDEVKAIFVHQGFACTYQEA